MVENKVDNLDTKVEIHENEPDELETGLDKHEEEIVKY